MCATMSQLVANSDSWAQCKPFETRTLRSSERQFRSPIVSRLNQRSQRDGALIAGKAAEAVCKCESNEGKCVASYGPFLQMHGGAMPTAVRQNTRKTIDSEGYVKTQGLLNMFLDKLMNHRKSFLLAFRLDLDPNATGNVTCEDFVRVWSMLGFKSSPIHAWRSWLPSDKSEFITLEDVCPDEIFNLCQFGEAIWCEVGFDLDALWAKMDEQGHGHITIKDFQMFCTKMFFSGDAELVYYGLDLDCLGKLTRDRLDYIRQYMVERFQSHMDELHKWFAEHFVEHDVVDFLVKFRLQRLRAFLFVDDLSSRLVALGFPGDALHAAFVISRTCGSKLQDEWMTGKMCLCTRVTRTVMCSFFGLEEPCEDVGESACRLYVPSSRIPGWIGGLGPQGFGHSNP